MKMSFNLSDENAVIVGSFQPGQLIASGHSHLQFLLPL